MCVCMYNFSFLCSKNIILLYNPRGETHICKVFPVANCLKYLMIVLECPVLAGFLSVQLHLLACYGYVDILKILKH